MWSPGSIDDSEASSVEGTMDRMNWRMVRRAIVRATAVLEATTVDVRRRDRVADGIRAGVRILDLVEVGGGYRRLHGVVPTGGAGDQPRRDGEVVYHSVVFARAGVDITRWRNRLFAVPIAIDVGAGPKVDFHLRIHTGLRIRASNRLFLGINAWNPTYTIYRSTSMLAPLNRSTRWSSQSTIEAGYIF